MTQKTRGTYYTIIGGVFKDGDLAYRTRDEAAKALANLMAEYPDTRFVVCECDDEEE